MDGSAAVVVLLPEVPVSGVEFVGLPPVALYVKVTTDPGRPGLTVREAKGANGCAVFDDGHDNTYGVAR